MEEHFAGKEPEVRTLFEALLKAARRSGELHVYAQKTRIVFQTRGRFVAVTPRKRYLTGHIWLKRRRAHATIHRVEALLDRDYVHHFRLQNTDEIDEAFCALLDEGYRVGSQTF